MKTYIGTKTVQARPMTLGEYTDYRGWDMPANKDDAGYLVEYLDGGKANDSRHAGYISWSPSEVFERAYREVPADEAQTEAQIQAKGLNAPRVTPERIAELMARVTFTGEVAPGTTSTFVHAFLDGVFFLATGHSACVSPENFDQEVGMKIARANAERAARDKLWELEGYALYKLRKLEGCGICVSDNTSKGA